VLYSAPTVGYADAPSRAVRFSDGRFRFGATGSMLFNSVEFLFLFLPLALIFHFCASRFDMRTAVIVTTLSSLFFYGWWKPAFVVLPALSIGFNFCLGRLIGQGDKRIARLVLILGIAVNLAVLGYFKYSDFLLSILQGRSPVSPDVPLALSFTTFVQIAFLVETYRRKEAPPFETYALFVTFFPHLIAGPIVRWHELGHQLTDKGRYKPDWDNIARGLTILCLGLAKKVLIADRLALFVAPVFDAAAQGSPVTAAAGWGASVAYSLQLYFDFSGYSDMAVGLGLLFNFRLPINFAAPFRATNIIDLWRRWHITLSRFLRDFVYVPLGGREHGRLRQSASLLATMTLGGLWHGANWTFIAWGAFHGMLLTLNHLWRAWRGPQPDSTARKALGWFLTFTAFAVGMTFFRANSIQAAVQMLQAMAGFGDATPNAPILVDFDFWTMEKGYVTEQFARTWFGSYWSGVGTLATLVALAIALGVPDTMELLDYREGEPHAKWRRPSSWLFWQPSPIWAASVLLLFGVIFANLGTFSEFLYYQF
jgi:alginate O-acetyltransferase complex protein AlgI